MNLEQPISNLLVIRSSDIHHAVTFYQAMGLVFDLHSHGKGPKHYASHVCGFTFEIYPQRNDGDTTTNTRLGFKVNDVDSVITNLREIDAMLVSEPVDSEWGRRAVVKDFDGHVIEFTSTDN